MSFEGNTDEQVKDISQQLTDAVEVILNPCSTPEQRKQASKFCEEFKDHSIYLTNCGIYLYNSNPSPIIKHFGLQLIHQAVKIRWNALAVEEKSSLKLMSLQFVAMGSGPLFEEPTYLKDAIAKLTVEIMKREWPQNWPDVFKNLSDISLKGECQLYIVLRVLLRLAEEVTTTESNMPTARRREMMTALSNILDELFKFFLKTLQFTVKKMKELKTQFGDSNNREVVLHKFLSEAVLVTLSGYVGWVGTKYLVEDNAVLLELLCLLLQDDELRMSAAECLELIVGRKGKLIERKPLLILFSVDAIKIMFNCVTAVVTGVLDEKTCTFLKRVCNILSLLGHLQLASIWGGVDCEDQDEPAHFNIYLEALITLYQHKNMLMTDLITKVWLSFLKNKEISKNDTFCSFIPKLMDVAKTKLSRASNPQNQDVSSFYFQIDFANDMEMQDIWRNVRSNTREIVQEITGLFPAESFLQAATWLLKLVESSPNVAPVTETSECYLEWDSMTVFLHSVLIRIFSKDSSSIKEFMVCQAGIKNSSSSICELGKQCIEALTQYNKEELIVMTLAILCLEALLPFIEFLRDLLQPVIHKIFNAISFVSPFQKPCGNQAALEFRRHAGAIWIRLCLTHKNMMVEMIDELTTHIHSFYSRDDFNSQERALLTEGLATISNGYMNYEKQKQYLGGLLAPIKDIWMTNKIEHALSSSESLIMFVGLDRSGDNEDDQCQDNRFQLQICLRFIHAILKRVEPPKDSQDQINGGFKVKHEDNPLNPCTSLLLPLLSNFFHLIRVLNNIWHPSVTVKVSPFYAVSLEIHESEKSAIIGLSGSEEKSSKEEKPKGSNVQTMKNFLFKLHEICTLILSDCSRLDEQFYSTPSLGQHLVNYVIETWQHLPNYRFRTPIRNFLKNYCRMCPPRYYDSAVIPVISSALTLIIERLNKEWEKVRSRENVRPYCVNDDDDDDEDENEDKSKEVIEGQLLHLLTKNFMETFFAICTVPRQRRDITETDENRSETNTEGTEVIKQLNPDDILEGLIKYLLKHTETCKLTLFTPFLALQWPDSSSFVKATKLCVPFIKQIVQCPPSGVAMESSMFEQLFTLLLKSLQLMGHNVEMQAQIIRCTSVIYDTLRPLFPELKSILLQVPNADARTIDEYDKSLFSQFTMTEKYKKKMFKGILAGLIGKEVGKMFQEDITILNLPAPPVVEKQSPVRLEDIDAKDIGLTRLFEPTT